MKREIKFRAWDRYKKDGKNHKMVYPNEGDFIGWHAPSNWKECYDVMQYTGLKDKNRKEIYEGDCFKGEGRTGQVKFVDGEWVVSFNNEYLYPLFRYIKNDPERVVIGNIYENPELLNQ